MILLHLKAYIGMRVDTDPLKQNDRTRTNVYTCLHCHSCHLEPLSYCPSFASFLGNKNTRCKSVICGLLFRIFLAVTKVLEGLQTRKEAG
jgi:hypothetical protein